MRKKFLSAFLSLILAAIFMSGCGCSPAATLAFSAAFRGDNNVGNNYKEVLTYDVSFSENDERFTRSESLTSVKNANFTGTYKSTLSVVTEVPCESDVTELTDVTIYRIKTEFNVTATVTVNETDYSHEDYIISEAYFADEKYSFAPIYSKTEAEYLAITASDASILKSFNETVYNQEKYQTISEYKYFETDAEDFSLVGEDVVTQSHESNYSFRTAIDNAQLLFALRGLSIKEKASATVSVIAKEYMQEGAKALSVTNGGAATVKVKITYNGVEYNEENITYNALNFRLSSGSVGSAQYLNVQSAASENIPNLALPIEYVIPAIVLPDAKLGAVIFKLSSVEITL